MKKVKALISKRSPKFWWLIIEFVTIFSLWIETENLFYVLVIKIISILGNDQAFNEEIADSPKRLAWNLLSFVGFVVGFALQKTGYVVEGTSLTIYIALAGWFLLQTGRFHKRFIEESI
ncbi:hypothetical protein PP175_29580 (plasmid) [Aneurinibacillus sp. Ricciae_BoGa-3]|uniref:hypothetical protein n=1 Tax=Aneurinibacillus sp. Ricciae_BoGa-3 TaxID=3022697 RepID=UPI002341BF8D|nr:hypothetical protein [Aneurinibacillus sp. Ricciae_BoGa-3]WCK57344.1 hypothetical protein PP175_29580 [Aneurinibacillus sp. Ricciae_BoGa-3]